MIALYFEFKIVPKLYNLEARRTERQDKAIDRRDLRMDTEKDRPTAEHAHKVFETIP